MQWLLDRAAIRDAAARDTVQADTATTGRVRNFLGTRLVTVEGDEAVVESYVLVTPIPDGEDRVRPAEVITPACGSNASYARTDAGASSRVRSTVPATSARCRYRRSTDDCAVRALLDRAMVIDAVTALSYAIDHEDESLLRACVSPDVTVGEAEIGVVSGVDALVDVLRATMWAMDGTWLFMNNHLVEVDGDDGHGAELRVHHRAARGRRRAALVDRRRSPVRRPAAATTVTGGAWWSAGSRPT